MQSDTCDNCHRPLAALDVDWLTDSKQALCGRSLLGTPLDPGLPEAIEAECAAARDRWLVAEVARLTAELTEARKPRWEVSENGWPTLGAQSVYYDGHYEKWCHGRAEYETFSEAKAAAEKACGVEVK